LDLLLPLLPLEVVAAREDLGGIHVQFDLRRFTLAVETALVRVPDAGDEDAADQVGQGVRERVADRIAALSLEFIEEGLNLPQGGSTVASRQAPHRGGQLCLERVANPFVRDAARRESVIERLRDAAQHLDAAQSFEGAHYNGAQCGSAVAGRREGMFSGRKGRASNDSGVATIYEKRCGDAGDREGRPFETLASNEHWNLMSWRNSIRTQGRDVRRRRRSRERGGGRTRRDRPPSIAPLSPGCESCVPPDPIV
jgi:hypothetical protein